MAPKNKTPNFATQPRQMLAGSEKPAFDSPVAKPASGAVTVSVILRRKNRLNPRSLGKERVTRAQYKANYAAASADVAEVRKFAKEFGLTVADSSPERRTMQLTGTVAAMQKAFGVVLNQATVDGATYRVREGGIHVPDGLSGIIVAVLGLDNRPQASPHFRVCKYPPDEAGAHANASSTNISYTPIQVANLYQFPTSGAAAGQTIALIELGGGFRAADITAYFKTLGVKAPVVSAVSVDKGKNAPTTSSSADGEVMLDIEIAAAVASGAKIVVYFAPNTDQGFIDAISTAVHDTVNKPSVVSISWGGPESSWTKQSMTALDQACQSAAALGITITVASGDNGSSDGVTDGANHVDFPASSPHVLACGGTKLIGSGSSITSEVVWNEVANNEGATGGGVSTVFALPSWQTSSNVPKAGSFAGRGVPDVAGNADPATGYTVRVDGQTLVIGGTSAVAPLWAGLIALNNAQNKKTAGFIQPAIYTAKARTAFKDTTSGNNGAFAAGAGWDACTGLGSPIGSALVKLLSASTAGGTKPAAKSSGNQKSAAKPVAKKATAGRKK